MRRRIVLLGATGYIGGLTAANLAEARERPLLVGRNAQSLAALGVRVGHGLDTAVVDLGQPERLLETVRPDDIIVNAAGPFARHGPAVVEAAIQRRATYIDCASEPAFVRDVTEDFGPVAEQAGVALLLGFGHRFVAGSLAASLVMEGLEDVATSADIAYFLTGPQRGALSSGARASQADAAMESHFAWRSGELVDTAFGDRVKTFPVGDIDLPAVAIGGLEAIVLPRLYPQLRDVTVYAGRAGTERAARRAARRTRTARRLPGGPASVRWWAGRPATVDGPAAESRERLGTTVVAVAYDGDGARLQTVTMQGVDPYTFTAATLSWAAVRAAADRPRGQGALAPVAAFGVAGLREACAGLASAFRVAGEAANDREVEPDSATALSRSD